MRVIFRLLNTVYIILRELSPACSPLFPTVIGKVSTAFAQLCHLPESSLWLLHGEGAITDKRGVREINWEVFKGTHGQDSGSVGEGQQGRVGNILWR